MAATRKEKGSKKGIKDGVFSSESQGAWLLSALEALSARLSRSVLLAPEANRVQT